MGLDLALGALILFNAVRGWLKGFVVQAIRLASIVVAVYAAAPLRDQVRPYVAQYLPTMRPELTDRMLWWSAGIASYFLIVGVASLLIAVSRRQTFGMAERNRGDQFAGFGLGLLKGLVIASFLVSSLGKYKTHLATLPWVDEQWKTSYATEWDAQYHPATRIWTAPPVQQFVGHIQKMGLMTPSDAAPVAKDDDDQAQQPSTVQTAARTPKLSLPQTAYVPPHRVRKPRLNLKPAFTRPGRATTPSEPDEPETQGLDPSLQKALETLKGQLGALPHIGDDDN